MPIAICLTTTCFCDEMIWHTNTEIQIFFEAKAACVSCTFAIHDFHKGVTALPLKNSALIRATADMMEQLLSSDNVYDILSHCLDLTSSMVECDGAITQANLYVMS